MGLNEFFLNGALEYGIPDIKVEVIKNMASKRSYYDTFKITDLITGREYFIRSGETGRGWCTVKCSRSRGVVQYGVLSLAGYTSQLDLECSVFVVERHIAKQRKKFEKSFKKG